MHFGILLWICAFTKWDACASNAFHHDFTFGMLKSLTGCFMLEGLKVEYTCLYLHLDGAVVSSVVVYKNNDSNNAFSCILKSYFPICKFVLFVIFIDLLECWNSLVCLWDTHLFWPRSTINRFICDWSMVSLLHVLVKLTQTRIRSWKTDGTSDMTKWLFSWW